LKLGTRALSVRVENAWLHGDRPILKLEGIDSISAAEPWVGAEILVEPGQVEPPADGEYSFADLVGCRVLSSGSELGVVDRIEEYGGPLLLAVIKPQGGEVLIPFAHTICKHIDVANKAILVELPEGLLEL